MKNIGRILAFVAVLILGMGPLTSSVALAGPRDAVQLEKTDSYPGVPTVLDFQRGVYKVNGKRWASFRAINEPVVGPELANPAAWIMSTAGTATATNSPPGTLSLTRDGTNGARGDLSVPTVAGRTYEFRFTVSNGPVSYRVGTVQGGSQLLSQTTSPANATVVAQFTATGSASWPQFLKTLAVTATVTNVSVREVGPVATVSRASEGYAQRSDGTWVRFAPNEARITDLGLLVEESRTNHVGNSAFIGATVGGPISGYGVSVTVASGLTTSITGLGVEDGLPFIEYTVAGTPSAGEYQLTLGSAINGTASVGQVWVGSLMARASGSMTGVNATEMRTVERASTTFNQASTVPLPMNSPRLGSARTTATRTLTDATSDNVSLRLRLLVTTGVPVNATFRVAAPQVELGAYASSPIVTTGAAATRAADTVFVSGLAGVLSTPFSALVEADFPAIDGVSRTLVHISSTGNQSDMVIFRRTSSDTLQVASVSSGVTQTAAQSLAGYTGARTPKIAARVDAGAYRSSMNGSLGGNVAFTNPVALARVDFGATAGPTVLLNGYIRRFLVWGRTLTDDELKGFSSQNVPLAANDNAPPSLLQWWDAA